MVIIGTSNPDADMRGNLDAMREADRGLGKGLGVKRREYTKDKKNLLRELNININKGVVNGAEYDRTKIIILKGKRLVFSEDTRKTSAVNKFKELVEKAKTEHTKTPAALVEEKLKAEGLENIPEDLTDSVLSESLERLDEEISERANEISVNMTENELRELRGILAEKGNSGEEKIKFLEVEGKHWREKSGEGGPKAKLYEAMADIVDLKTDEIRLRHNLRPESERARSIVEEEADTNDLTRLERFKRWAKKNIGGISVVAISVAGIITTIVMGFRNAVRKGASATSKFAKALAKVGEKVAPVLGELLNLVAKVLTLGAKGVGFLSKNLWILAVTVAHALAERHKRKA